MVPHLNGELYFTAMSNVYNKYKPKGLQSIHSCCATAKPSKLGYKNMYTAEERASSTYRRDMLRLEHCGRARQSGSPPDDVGRW
jgi:hypothetical protein